MTRRAWQPVLALVIVVGLAVMAAGCGTSTPTVKAGNTYVALGDSYTAFPGTSTEINTPCHRSSGDYPHLLASALKYPLTDMSCSGAATKDLTGSQKPGVLPQLAALGTSTKLVTVSIGANNDAISTVLLLNCTFVRWLAPSGAPCAAKTATWYATVFTKLRPALVASYKLIREKAPNARVIAIDYPQILGNSGTCAKYQIATGDVAFLNQLNTRLNDTVRAAAAEAGIEFLDIAPASLSHGICSTSPWIAGSEPIPGVALQMHPFASEQQAVAAMLEQKLRTPTS